MRFSTICPLSIKNCTTALYYCFQRRNLVTTKVVIHVRKLQLKEAINQKLKNKRSITGLWAFGLKNAKKYDISSYVSAIFVLYIIRI